MGKYEVTRGQFLGIRRSNGPSTHIPDEAKAVGEWKVLMRMEVVENASNSWRSPGFGQTDRDPVVCVSWDDAKAYSA